MNRLWKIVTSMGFVLGLVASVISIWTVVKADRIEDIAKLAVEAGKWVIKPKIIEPEEGTEVSGVVVRIVGNIEFRTAATDTLQSNNVNLMLHQNQVELVCYIRPLSKNNFWYLQSKPLIEQNGRFECLGFIEHNESGTSGIKHQIVALIIPKKYISKNFRNSDLPFYYASSNIVVVKSVR